MSDLPPPPPPGVPPPPDGAPPSPPRGGFEMPPPPPTPTVGAAWSTPPLEERPGEITTVGYLCLAGGLWAMLEAVLVALVFCCWIWPIQLVAAIFVAIHGFQVANDRTRDVGAWACWTLIAFVLNCDVISMILGVVGLVLLNGPAVRAWRDSRRMMR